MFDKIKTKISPLLRNDITRRIRGVPLPNLKGDQASNFIYELLTSERPILVNRVGESEGHALSYYYKYRFLNTKNIQYTEEICQKLSHMTGFFPCTPEAIDNFCKRNIESISNSDLYAAWTKHDKKLEHFMPRSLCRLVDLEPFHVVRPWTLALENKRVLIVSPLEEEIRHQYAIRESLFQIRTLPDFDLRFVRPPQTQGGEQTTFQSWAQAMQCLWERVQKTEFEVALIGAGAYGPPLANLIKESGRSAIVLGGALQLIFGIRGRRWEQDKRYNSIMNEHWIRPNPDKRPKNYSNMEKGAYW